MLHSYRVHRDVRSGARSLTQTQEDVLSVAIAGLCKHVITTLEIFESNNHFILFASISVLGILVWLSEYHGSFQSIPIHLLSDLVWRSSGDGCSRSVWFGCRQHCGRSSCTIRKFRCWQSWLRGRTRAPQCVWPSKIRRIRLYTRTWANLCDRGMVLLSWDLSMPPLWTDGLCICYARLVL